MVPSGVSLGLMLFYLRIGKEDTEMRSKKGITALIIEKQMHKDLETLPEMKDKRHSVSMLSLAL